MSPVPRVSVCGWMRSSGSRIGVPMRPRTRYCYAAPPSGGALILPRLPPRGMFPRYARRAFFTMGDSPFFTTSASEFFIPLAGAVFMTSETSPSPPRTIPMPRFMSPACWRTPAGAAGGVHIFFYATRGSRPLYDQNLIWYTPQASAKMLAGCLGY